MRVDGAAEGASMISGARAGGRSWGEELTASWLGCKCRMFLGAATRVVSISPSAVATLPRLLRLVLLPAAGNSLCGVLTGSCSHSRQGCRPLPTLRCCRPAFMLLGLTEKDPNQSPGKAKLENAGPINKINNIAAKTSGLSRQFD